jgi:hypothetical protein
VGCLKQKSFFIRRRSTLKRRAAIVFAILATPFGAMAGCIGPVIMGECKGQMVEWDTHPQGASNAPPPAPGFYYDKRGTNAEQINPGSVNPFTGRDAHDANVNANNRSRCYQHRDALARQGVFIKCP